MSENKLLDLSFEFAVSIVNLVDRVTAPKSTYMTNQIARSGTSVGANIYEAQYAQSKKDFVAKLEIALKESNETSYMLRSDTDDCFRSNQTQNRRALQRKGHKFLPSCNCLRYSVHYC